MREVLEFIVIIPMIIILIGTIFALVRNEVVYRNHMKIADAIHRYDTDCLNEDREYDIVLFSHMESYDDTYKRFWDWGYKHILPEEDFKKIEKYIK